MSVPAAFLAVVLIWSTTPLAVKWSGEGPGYLGGALGRMTLAALLCVALLVAPRRDFPWHRAARRAYLSGALMRRSEGLSGLVDDQVPLR